MNEDSRTVEILLQELPQIAPGISPDLVRSIFHVEERLQFDNDRAEAAPQIKKLVQVHLEKDLAKGAIDGDES